MNLLYILIYTCTWFIKIWNTEVKESIKIYLLLKYNFDGIYRPQYMSCRQSTAST